MEVPNSVIKEFKFLEKKKNRKEAYQYLVEGIRGCEELIKATIKPEKIVYSESIFKYDSGIKVMKEFDQMGVEMYKLNENLFRKVCCTQSPQGIICIVPMKILPIKPELEKENANFLIIDKVSDPGNLGTIIRSAAAFNINGIFILPETVELYNPKTIRSAMGSHLLLPILYDIPMEELLIEIDKYNIELILSDPYDGSDYRQIRYPDKFAIVVGNEHHGVSKEFYEKKHQKAKIPTNDKVDSLNAAIAASIIFAHIA